MSERELRSYLPISVGDQRFALPMTYVSDLERAILGSTQAEPVYHIEGHHPVERAIVLTRWFWKHERWPEPAYAVIVTNHGALAALIVDAVHPIVRAHDHDRLPMPRLLKDLAIPVDALLRLSDLMLPVLDVPRLLQHLEQMSTLAEPDQAQAIS
ncbi:MAG: hypothetical protein GYB68_07940 [Chloroflexi bacterium]|nr:hypothetical protein [Chloroflexota bacterium]